MQTCTDIFISPSTSIRESVEIIDKGRHQIALVVDGDFKLLGTVTDGDVRRAILRAKDFSVHAEEIMNRNPITASIDTPAKVTRQNMLEKGIRAVPVVDDDGRVLGLEVWNAFQPSHSKHENWVVLMAGGLGHRLTPLTDSCPKPLLKVGPKPILETILESFIAQHFDKFFLSVNYKGNMIEDYFGDGSKWGVTIKYLKEEKRMGTAGALSLLPVIPDSPLIVMNGDLLTSVNFEQLLQFHLENKSAATMCVREHTYTLPYGVVQLQNHQFMGIEEKPVQQLFVNAGIYVIDPKVLTLIQPDIYTDMTTCFQQMVQQHYHISAFPIREYWLDIGKMDDYVRANREYTEVFP
ncbi:nucleotidyltransferase family protein [Alicyclobacillus sp. SO9]|uniref:nucleotidyltransferase family protein n=1 Tax=Alicyclobacillus sp. SO9 TaxID=2665646 RepID=UPI0018E80F0A|nr:nucleotidyltransferase family protein [Alicyclobacillus sp. SO9]QQE78258.1 nucleotidyltransferase family protein [Alicyclobacillus sp. SO9]